MSKYPATFKNKVYDKNGYAVHLFYEYRGMEYMITDEHNGYSEPMWVKHKNEQERIDRILKIEEEQKKTKILYENSADYGFQIFWDALEQG